MSHRYPEWQHGARPNKGVNTCWEVLWKELHSKNTKYIYEFDLTKFFDLVRHESIQEALKEGYRLPKERMDFIMASIRKPVSDLSYKALKQEWENLKEAYEKAGKVNKDWAKNSGMYLIHNGKKLVKPKTSAQAEHGVPQGYSLSPLLACATLANDLEGCRYTSKYFGAQEGLYRKAKDRILMYMDDGLIISNEPLDGFGLKTDFEMTANLVGTQVNLKKSRMIMENGQWLVDKFKFLGVEYIPGSDTLKAMTRNGSEKWFPGSEVGKMDLRGPSSRIFLRYLESHGDIATAQKYGFFNAILAEMWKPGEAIKYVGDRLLVYAPLSFCSYYIDELDKMPGRTTKVNVSSKASQLLASFVKQTTRKNRVVKGPFGAVEVKIPKVKRL
jgi:hypothetical protein